MVESTKLKRNFKRRDQICGSSGSVMDNRAEGFERDGNLEFRQFLSIAKGSAGETKSQLYGVYEWDYINEEIFNKLINDCLSLSRRLSNFINYLNKKEYKGNNCK